MDKNIKININKIKRSKILKKSYFIFFFLALFFITLIGIIIYVFFIKYKVDKIEDKFGKPGYIYPFGSKRAYCRCLRQPNGNKGFCGFCSRNGKAFACPQGKYGCKRDCSKITYKGRDCNSCKDKNC